MFANIDNVDNSKYAEMTAKIDADASLRTKFTANLSLTGITELMGKYKFDMGMFAKLRSYAQKKERTVNTNSYVLSVLSGEKDNPSVHEVKEMDTSKRFVNGVWMRVEDPTPFKSLLHETAVRIRAMTMVKDTNIIPIPSSTNVPVHYRHDIVPIGQVCDQMNSNNIKGEENICNTLDKEILNPASSKKLVSAVVRAAPMSLKPAVKESNGLCAMLSVPKFELMPKVDDEVKDKIIDVFSRSPYPKASFMNEYANKHVFGVDIPKAVVNYVGLAYDCDIPEDFKTVHVHSSDIKYTVVLANKYPNKKFVYATKTPLGDGKGTIVGKRSEEMYENTKGVFGVFVEFHTPPVEKEKPKDKEEVKKASDYDKWDRFNASKYSAYFRYCSAMVMREDGTYKPSFVTAKGKVCETTHGDKYYRDHKTMINMMVSILIHRYVYVWYGIPLCVVLKDFYKPLHGFKCSLVMAKEHAKNLLGDAFAQFCGGTNDFMAVFDEFHDNMVLKDIADQSGQDYEEIKSPAPPSSSSFANTSSGFNNVSASDEMNAFWKEFKDEGKEK